MNQIYKSSACIAALLLGAYSLSAQMRITEYEYNGSEFVEFTNVGTTAIDMTGWSFSDNARNPGDVSLSAYGIVQAGESVILSEESESGFRTRWGLCAGVKIIGGNSSNNLGRSDEINLYDNTNTLIDRLTYNDQGTAPLGGPRTDTKSAWVQAIALGTNEHNKWTASSLGDAEGSVASTPAAYFASPGKSTRATVIYDPCALPSSGNPTIIMDLIATSSFISGNAATAPLSPFAVSGVLSDPTDPLSTTGISFTIGDDLTPVGSLSVTASSSNTTVVPNANIILSGTGSTKNIKITPAAVGYANISITVSDGSNTTTYVVNYAASAAAANPAASVYHTGYSDASTAVALDDNYMIISDDEKNILNVYDRHQSGMPVKSFDYASVLNLTDMSGGQPREIDLEASAKGIANTSRVFWMGSHSNKSNPNFDLRPNRNRIFATDISNTGAATSFTFAGYYDGLRTALSTWSNINSLGLDASMADGYDPKVIDGFNIEGMAFGPDNTTMYIGFRAPLQPTTNRVNALIAPIQNFETWFGNGTTTDPVLGTPILLDLGGRGIREISRISQNLYVIVAGDYGDNGLIASALYKWNGNPADAPVLMPGFNVASFNPEGLLPVNVGGSYAENQLEIINDNGTADYYNDAIAAKDLSVDAFKKFSSDILLAPGEPLPVVFQHFKAIYASNGIAHLQWNVDNIKSYRAFEIERSADGISFERVATMKVGDNTGFAYDDKVCCVESYLYRIRAISVGGESTYSNIQIVRLPGAAQPANIVHVWNSNDLTVYTNSDISAKHLNIYNMNGQPIYMTDYIGAVKNVNLSSFSSGTYIVEVIQSGNTTRKKIVK